MLRLSKERLLRLGKRERAEVIAVVLLISTLLTTQTKYCTPDLPMLKICTKNETPIFYSGETKMGSKA